jgi:nucleoside-diphosphate-sugar epimerase
MVNAGVGDKWSDEDTAFAGATDDVAGRASRAALDMEHAVTSSGLDWLVLRGALFYGPGTGFDDDWVAWARAGTLRVPGDGSGFVSLVHIADMARATVAALARWPGERTLIIADDRPPRWGELFHHVCAVDGGSAPGSGGRLGFPSFRVRNTRAREALDWAPAYRDHGAGLAR